MPGGVVTNTTLFWVGYLPLMPTPPYTHSMVPYHFLYPPSPPLHSSTLISLRFTCSLLMCHPITLLVYRSHKRQYQLSTLFSSQFFYQIGLKILTSQSIQHLHNALPYSIKSLELVFIWNDFLVLEFSYYCTHHILLNSKDIIG